MILVTGGAGFVGNTLIRRLAATTAVRGGVRSGCAHQDLQLAGGWVHGNISPEQNWLAALRGVKCVIHCAARVHVMNDRAVDPLAEFRRVNVAGTLNLARQAADAGVKRFVFVSSIKVNGEVVAYYRDLA